MKKIEKGYSFLETLLILFAILLIGTFMVTLEVQNTATNDFQKYFGVNRGSVSNSTASHNTFQPLVDQKLSVLKQLCAVEVSRYKEGANESGTSMSKAYDDYQRAYRAARYFGFKVPEISNCQ